MRLNMDANNNETKNVAMEPQVNNNPIEDAQAVEVTTEADVAEVDDIAPKVTKRAVAQAMVQEANGGPATTMPLGKHGSIVIAGVGGTKKEEPKANSQKPDPEAVGELVGMLTKVQLVVYKTKKGADAPMITGFGGDDDPRWKKLFDAKPKWVSAGYRRDAEDNKVYHLMFGSRYMDVAKALCEAYNTTDEDAWAAAEQACADNYNGIVSGYKAEKEARKAERQAKKNAAKAADKPKAEKTYTLDEVAKMLGTLLPDGAAKTEDIKKLLKAA